MKELLLVFVIISSFFILGTSTSIPDENIEYECTVKFENLDIILKSESPTNVENAFINLFVETAPEASEVYQIRDYFLDAFAADTIPLYEFLHVTDSIPLNNEGKLIAFEMEFYRSDTTFFKFHEF